MRRSAVVSVLAALLAAAPAAAQLAPPPIPGPGPGGPALRAWTFSGCAPAGPLTADSEVEGVPMCASGSLAIGRFGLFDRPPGEQIYAVLDAAFSLAPDVEPRLDDDPQVAQGIVFGEQGPWGWAYGPGSLSASWYVELFPEEVAGAGPGAVSLLIDYTVPGQLPDDYFGSGWDMALVPVSVIPEPGTWALVGLGLVGVLGAARRRV